MSEVSNTKWHQKISWPVALFLGLNPLFCIVLVPLYYIFNDFSWALIIFSFIFAAATNLSITAGYHRLFSHKSYDAHPIAKIIFLLIGASAWQGSALKWSSDHRRHHSHIDGDKDPYNINRGFFFAHMGWMLLKESIDQPIQAIDLQKDKWISLQDKHYVKTAIFMGYIFPGLIGWMMGNFWGGVLIAGALRIVLTQQSTFFVNSLCHTLGRQTYSKDISARDSLFVAFLTHGEGYHNFHHTFQIDYRNGIRWYHWDPTKWTIKFLAIIGLAKKLRKISNIEILKARLLAEEKVLKNSGLAEEKLVLMRNKILSAQIKMRQLHAEYQQIRRDYYKRKVEISAVYELKLLELKRDLGEAKLEFQMGMKIWKVYLKTI